MSRSIDPEEVVQPGVQIEARTRVTAGGERVGLARAAIDRDGALVRGV